jgi:DNA-binding HxlR family transcriptional regulator
MRLPFEERELLDETEWYQSELFEATHVSRLTDVLLRNYDTQVCSVARSLELIGERWTLLIVRDVFVGVRRFDELQADLGIARNVLTERLARLVDGGVLERHRYQERPERFEYRLTQKGLDLWPVLVSLLQWGDRYYAPAEGPPLVLVHRDCGGRLAEGHRCDRCGDELTAADVKPTPGPGAARVVVA